MLTAAFGIGAILGGLGLIFSTWQQGAPNWVIGIGLVLGGHACLAIATVGWILGLRSLTRSGIDETRNVAHRAEDLQEIARRLSVTQSSPSQAFYSHLAQGAGPDVLLADLKGQLDLLAARFSRRAA